MRSVNGSIDNTYEPVLILHLNDMSIFPLARVGFNDGPFLQESLTLSNPETLNATYMLFDP
jgi:hypothetical protein